MKTCHFLFFFCYSEEKMLECQKQGKDITLQDDVTTSV